MKPHNNLQQYFFFSIVAIVGVLTVFMFIPFLAPVLLALVCVTIFYPLHKKVSKLISKGNMGSSFSALISLATVLLIVLIPLSFIAIEVSIEAKSVYDYLTVGNGNLPSLDYVNEMLSKYSDKLLPGSDETVLQTINISDYIKQVLKLAFTNIDSIFSSAAKIFFEFIILLLAIFYFFRDGESFRKQIIKLSPLDDTEDEQIFKRLSRAVSSIIKGTIFVSVIQGILAGIGFTIFGVPSPALWGSVAMVAALVPGFGTSLVLFPAVIYLFINGSLGMALGLLIWAVLAVGLIDNLLAPKLMGSGTGVHPFLILLSVVGGLTVFGPVGFIAGPLVVSLLYAVMDIHRQFVSS
ncbi:MAG: AI-2E family transporter [bacterium]|nr:AI-2E family transporter [bacterium]